MLMGSEQGKVVLSSGKGDWAADNVIQHVTSIAPVKGNPFFFVIVLFPLRLYSESVFSSKSRELSMSNGGDDGNGQCQDV